MLKVLLPETFGAFFTPKWLPTDRRFKSCTNRL